MKNTLSNAWTMFAMFMVGMGRYMGYLLVNVRKKLSTYLVPVIYAVVVLGMLWLYIHESNKGSISSLTSLNIFLIFLAFIFTGLFVGTKSLNIFKDGEDDGSELLIVSKPISRSQIVMGKFFTLYTLIIAFSLFMFTVVFIIAQLDHNATEGLRFRYALSFGVGTLMLSLILSSIIALISIALGKIGTMTLSILLPAVLPIVSFMLVPMGGGSALSTGNLRSALAQTNYTKLHDDGTNDSLFIYSDEIEKETSKDAGWYKYYAPFDMFQHLGRFYKVGITQGNPIASTSSSMEASKAKVHTSTWSAPEGGEYTIKLDGNKYGYRLFSEVGGDGNGGGTVGDAQIMPSDAIARLALAADDDERDAISDELNIFNDKAARPEFYKVIAQIKAKYFAMIDRLNDDDPNTGLEKDELPERDLPRTNIQNQFKYISSRAFDREDASGNNPTPLSDLIKELIPTLTEEDYNPITTLVGNIYFRLLHDDSKDGDSTLFGTTIKESFKDSDVADGNSQLLEKGSEGFFLAEDGATYKHVTVDNYISTTAIAWVYGLLAIALASLTIFIYFKKDFK